MQQLNQIHSQYERLSIALTYMMLMLLVCSSWKLTGQKQFFGIKFQMNYSGAYSDDFYNDHNYITRFGGGITYDHWMNKHFSIGAELIYNPMGHSDLVEGKDENGNDVTGTFPIYYHFNYLSLPLKFSVLFEQGVIFYSGIDLIPSLLINASYFFPDNFPDKSIAGHSYTITKDVRKLNFAVSPQIGIGFNLSKKNLLCFSAGYFFALTNNFTGYLKNQGLSLSLGLKRQLSTFN